MNWTTSTPASLFTCPTTIWPRHGPLRTPPPPKKGKKAIPKHPNKGILKRGRNSQKVDPFWIGLKKGHPDLEKTQPTKRVPSKIQRRTLRGGPGFNLFYSLVVLSVLGTY